MKLHSKLACLAFALWGLAAFAPATLAQGIPKLTTLHSFSRQLGVVNTDGAASVSALIQGPDGNFYGTTAREGASGRARCSAWGRAGR